MSSQENRIIAYLVSNLLGVSLYIFFAIQHFRQPGFDANTITSRWGTIMLIVIGVQIVLSIILSIAVTIIQAITTRDEEIERSDERDHLIGLKADRISFSVFGVGFVIAMITLAAGLAPLVMFNLIVFSLFGAAIAGYVTQLFLYRRGF